MELQPGQDGYAKAFIAELKSRLKQGKKMPTVDEIKSKYGVQQNDASGNLADAIMGISNACANAKKALQKATKYISDPRLKTLNTRLTAAFNAIDSFNAGADALNDKLIGFRK